MAISTSSPVPMTATHALLPSGVTTAMWLPGPVGSTSRTTLRRASMTSVDAPAVAATKA
jgi:hypothetical protein